MKNSGNEGERMSGRSLTSLSDEPILFGVCVSLVLHAALFYVVFYRLSSEPNPFAEPVVYSVTLEGGKTIGGKSQVQTSDKETPIAPPKNVSSDPEPPSKVEPIKNADDAEVSIATPKPTATPKAKVTPKPSPVPTKKVEQKKEEAKKVAKATPTKKATPAPDPDKEYQKAMQRYLGESADAGGKGFGAAKVGGKGMGGGLLRSPEFIAYYNMLRAYIKKGWHWYDRDSPLLARAYFRIERDGTVKEIRLTQSSGNKEFDDSVLRALAKADPVPPPPEKEYQNFREITMTFDPRE